MTDGRLVLVFDDGATADRDCVRPVLDDRGVPACFAVVADWIGTEGCLDADDIRDLADDGNEIAAHGRRHRYLQAVPCSRDPTPDDRRVFVDPEAVPGGEHGFVTDDWYELTDGDRREVLQVVGTGEIDEGRYVEFAEGPSATYDAVETVLRPTRDVLRDEVVGAGEALRDLGVTPRTFVLPYDAADPRAWALVREHYDALPDAATRSLPNPPGTSLTNCRRYYLETDALTRVEIGTYLDRVAADGGLGILAGHSAWDTVTPERVGWVVDAARDRDIEMTTFERLLEAGYDQVPE